METRFGVEALKTRDLETIKIVHATDSKNLKQNKEIGQENRK